MLMAAIRRTAASAPAAIHSARFINSLIDGLCKMRQASQFGRTRPVS